MTNLEIKCLVDFYQDHWCIHHYASSGYKKPNILEAEEYLKKYGLSNASYQSEWKSLHNSTFDLNKELPNMIFKKDFEFISLLGGLMFEQKDFRQFRSCIQAIGGRNIVIMQDSLGMCDDMKPYTLNMKYPSNIRWEELMSGSFISVALFEASLNYYYIFGDNGEWGMYVANDFIGDMGAIRIIGFNPKYRDIFRTTFEIPEGEYCENLDYILEEERSDLKMETPEAYRNIK